MAKVRERNSEVQQPMRKSLPGDGLNYGKSDRVFEDVKEDFQLKLQTWVCRGLKQ